jgi:GAF domain-containing protein
MSESLFIEANASKSGKYTQITPQIEALVAYEPNKIANMANTCAALRQTFGFFWVGFYLVESSELVLGPFQGDIACTRIAKGRGVCGTAWNESRTIIVADVDEFPGHIACSSLSRSEIVLPIFRDSQVVGVLDIDSEQLAHFDETDQLALENLLTRISAHLV